jgi:hypothetical protein
MQNVTEIEKRPCYETGCHATKCINCGGKPFAQLFRGRHKKTYRRYERRIERNALNRNVLAFYHSSRIQKVAGN